MPDFEYVAPTTVDDVASLMQQCGDEAKILAGGQSLMILLRQGFLRPRCLVSLRKVEGLEGISVVDGGLRLGARTTNRNIEQSADVRRMFPLLSEAASKAGPVHVRNWGTVGGNICHNEIGSDLPPPLLALNASCLISGLGGVRSVPVDEFFVGNFETVVQDNEFLTAIEIPAPPKRWGGAYLKLCVRAADKSIVGVAAVVELQGGNFSLVRLGLGGVTGAPFRAKRAEAMLTGKSATESVIDEAAQIASDERESVTDAFASSSYRKSMVKVMVRRALRQACQRFEDQT